MPADAQFRVLVDGMTRRINELRAYLELLNTDVQGSLSRLEADLEQLRQLAPAAGRGPIIRLQGASPIPQSRSPVPTRDAEGALRLQRAPEPTSPLPSTSSPLPTSPPPTSEVRRRDQTPTVRRAPGDRPPGEWSPVPEREKPARPTKRQPPEDLAALLESSEWEGRTAQQGEAMPEDPAPEEDDLASLLSDYLDE